jgi:hypothetical protein
MDRRGLLRERRREERRTRAINLLEDDRRSGRDRRVGERRVALPPLSRLVPALLVVAVSLVDLAVAQTTPERGWSLLVILAAIAIAAYDLVNPWRWRWHLTAVWIAVSVYVMAAGVHIGYMLAR